MATKAVINTKTSEVKAHAKYSASGADRWLNCPASIELSARAPEARESEYAAEGTKAHACLELMLKNRNNLNLALKLAKKSYPLDMVEYALDAVNWINEQAGDDDVLCEQKVDASPFTTDGQFGTLDAAIIRDFDRLTVIDYKYGAGLAVEPAYDNAPNPQLTYYALGLSHEYGHAFTEVELVVIQPRAFHESGETIRSAVFPIEEILAEAEKFKAGVKRCEDPLAELNAGRWCKYCPAAVICPELKENAMKQAQIVFADNEIESVPEVRTLTLSDLGKALDVAERLEAFIQALRDHATYVLECGGKVPGWKLVDKRGIRKWKDEAAATEVAKTRYWKDVAFSEPKLLSPAQLEKKICKKGTWSDAADGFLEEHVTTASSGTTLVKESDKRPAVKPMDKVFNLE